MTQRDEIVAYANELLDVERFPEYGTPGLQVVGADGVEARLRRLELSGALRARRRDGCAAPGRPPRHVLAQRAGLDRPAPARPAGSVLRSYTAPWDGEPLASAAFPSPAQAFLGLFSLLMGSSPWLAQRVAVFGLLPVAWFLALRAGRLVTRRRWPRVLGATVYALSVPVLGALASGRFGALVIAALLPGLVAVTFRAGDPRTPPGSAWRAAGLLALGLAVCASAAPIETSMLVTGVVIALLVVALAGGPGRRAACVRLLVALGGAALLLAPWAVDVLRESLDGASLGLGLALRAEVAELPLWRALLLAPGLLAGLAGSGVVVPSLVTGAVVLAGLLVGLRARPVLTAALVLLIVVSGLGAVALTRLQVGLVWVPAVLLPGALALAVLAVVVGRWFRESLGARDFGLRRITITLAGAAVTVALLASTAALADTPWDDLRLDPALVPAFVSSQEGVVGPYRVLLLNDAGDAEGVRWEVTRGGGPSMQDYGTVSSPRLLRAFADLVATLAAGGDPSAGDQLGLLNVRYVVLTEPSEALPAALVRQPALDPLPVSGGQVYEVTTWLPRAVVVPADAAEALLADGVPPAGVARVSESLVALAPGQFSGRIRGTSGGLVVVSEASNPQWQAAADGQVLERVQLGDVNAFVLPAGDAERTVSVEATGAFRRRLIVLGQIIVGLLVLSLAVRPPGVTERRLRARVLPAELSGVGAATGPIPVGALPGTMGLGEVAPPPSPLPPDAAGSATVTPPPGVSRGPAP